MQTESKDKIERVLGMYSKLMNGYIVNKAEEAQIYGVNERSIQRDIEDIRGYMDTASTEDGIINTVIYDRNAKGYRLEQIYEMKLSNSEILAICKILLDSRAFTKKEMTKLISRLVECCVPKVNRKEVNDLIKNEEYHYIELQHRSEFVDKMWDIGKAIREHNFVDIEYQRTKDKALVKRRIKPVSIMFSEYYFYITAFIDNEEIKADFDVLDDSYPTIYRIDRIKKYKILPEKFNIPYANRFEEGEFKKRIQFMYGGKLQRVRFNYSGNSVEAVLDRLPTAKIENEKEGVYTITAEVFGKGIEMWLRSQGDMVNNIEIK
ncbi:WYL domain-containing protein [[Clostridium] aminophilum]|uniref:WYL domain-containing protein n=1 Tax=[Clostridium] aminophilum TaxID=1526 RepID=A0A1I0GRH7_9FIRM|nr:WYL domain-containing protein [[Clostridium] aminophilum]SET73723.1 WYL domain-containing protein [[Clostridium] aminophilum]